MLRKVGIPKGYAPALEAAPDAAPVTAPERPARPSLGSLLKPRRAKPSVPMTGEAQKPSAPRLPDLVRYESFEGRMRRRWVPGFTRRGPGVPEGWLEDGSIAELKARKEAGLADEAALGKLQKFDERVAAETRRLNRAAAALPHIMKATRLKQGRFR